LNTRDQNSLVTGLYLLFVTTTPTNRRFGRLCSQQKSFTASWIL